MTYNFLQGKFIRGPISLHQLLEFSKHGINAVRIFMYIRMQEGILLSKKMIDKDEHICISISNFLKLWEIIFAFLIKMNIFLSN